VVEHKPGEQCKMPNELSSRFIVHVVPDEKFIDMACREFELVAPGANRFIIIGRPHRLRYVRSPGVAFVSLGGAARLFRDPRCAAIVFHTLGDAYALDRAPAGKPIVWIGWGFDYYDRLLSSAYPEGLFLPRTRELMRGKPPAVKEWRSRLIEWRLAASRMLGRAPSLDPILLSKVTYFSPVIDEEYDMARRLSPWFNASLLPWNYGTVEDDLVAGKPGPEGPGRNFLVGNSATFENNHLEVFDLLRRRVNLSGRKIIVPLSYGDAWYRDEVIKAGNRLFGDGFVPLTRFMPQEQYLELLQTCGHVFMNHLRQQGLGNICIMMLQGARIYMNRASPAYRWLRERGASITSLDCLESDRADEVALEPLSQAERRTNENLVRAQWGREVQRERTSRFIQTLLGTRACLALAGVNP
jgi:dTDP-N-acetylfucosamine:lipid II N-acetylfucosaminyltransferase